MNGTLIKFLIDLALWAAAALFAYAFRKPTLVTFGIPLNVVGYIGLSVVVMAVAAWYYRLPRQTWRRVGVPDLMVLARAVMISTLVMFALGFILQSWLQLPRSVPLLSGVLGVLLMGSVRVLSRLLAEKVRSRGTPDQRRVLIVGAGSAGALFAREMLRHPESGLRPIGFMDDEAGKQRQLVVGLPVFGRIADLPQIVSTGGLDCRAFC